MSTNSLVSDEFREDVRQGLILGHKWLAMIYDLEVHQTYPEYPKSQHELDQLRADENLVVCCVVDLDASEDEIIQRAGH